jgi:hypothetical protein
VNPIVFTELADTDIDEIWISIARAVLRIAHGARNLELIEFPPGPQEVREAPLIFGRDVFDDAAERMGDTRLRIS